MMCRYRWGTGSCVYGLFSGLFLGSWVIALGEVIDVYAITMRRLGIVQGIQYLILSMALGKILGSLLFFYRDGEIRRL